MNMQTGPHCVPVDTTDTSCLVSRVGKKKNEPHVTFICVKLVYCCNLILLSSPISIEKDTIAICVPEEWKCVKLFIQMNFSFP